MRSLDLLILFRAENPIHTYLSTTQVLECTTTTWTVSHSITQLQLSSQLGNLASDSTIQSMLCLSNRMSLTIILPQTWSIRYLSIYELPIKDAIHIQVGHSPAITHNNHPSWLRFYSVVLVWPPSNAVTESTAGIVPSATSPATFTLLFCFDWLQAAPINPQP